MMLVYLLCMTILDYFYAQLTWSSNDAIKPGQYLLHVQPKQLVGYTSIDSQEAVWTWKLTDIYGYRLERKTVPEVEITIGT